MGYQEGIFMVSMPDSRLIALLALAVSSTAQAATGVQVNLRRPLTLYPINQSSLVQNSTNGPVELSSTTAFGNGHAYADFGVIKISSSMYGNIRVPDSHVTVPTYPYPQDFSSASGFWRDDVVIRGGSGGGIASVRLFIEGNHSTLFPSAQGSSSATASVSLRTNNGLGQSWDFNSQQVRYRDSNGLTSLGGGTSINRPGPDYQDRIFPTVIKWSGWQEFNIDFTFGTPFELRVDALCFTSGNTGVFNGINSITQLSGASVGTFCDLGQSVYWGGITGVSTASGSAISGYEVSSFSGFNYRNASPALPGDSAVPEPASWAMLIAGFGLVGGSLRRRRTTQDYGYSAPY
jgi:PEP-CTERM motif